MKSTARCLAAAGALAAVAACANTPPSRPIPAQALTSDVAPATIDGLTVAGEQSAQAAFTQAPKTSMVARGQLMTLRKDGQVVAALQVSQLKVGLRNDDERVKAGIRASIEKGTYRWFKIDDKQWVGVQAAAQINIYLWFPADRTDAFEVMQTRSSLDNPDGLVADIIRYQGSRL